MRSLAIVLPASLILVLSVHGQVLTEHAAAAAGAVVGSGAGKSLSNSMTKIFGDTDKQTAKVANPDAKKQSKPVPSAPDPLAAKSQTPLTAGGDAPLDPLPPSGSSVPSRSRSRAVRKPAPQDATAAALSHPMDVRAIAQPIVKVPTVQDIASIKVGTTEDDLVAALGQPSSRVSIPDDDGHLRETCQYWVDGRQLGTIRLDNGQVVTIETRPEN
jgi:outer membrane protein assembly factor BamE (lipoprotein component of BamABCDE complex)